MEQKRYIISDAAGLVKVETHVLRYWEEELELKIPRNELGHRYYTPENIEEFRRIKELKEQGYQLKAIKALIHSKDEPQEQTEMAKQEERYGNMQVLPVQEAAVLSKPQRTEVSVDKPVASVRSESDHSQSDSIERFQMLMNAIVKNAIVENNTALGKEVTRQVAERVLKEMNYLARTQEEQEEERYRKLDEAIRANQKGRKARKEKEKKQTGSKHLLRPKLTT